MTTDVERVHGRDVATDGPSAAEMADLLASAPTAADTLSIGPVSQRDVRSVHPQKTQPKSRPQALTPRPLCRIRFVFYTVEADEGDVARYHEALVDAEGLFDRALRAHRRGLRAIHAGLGAREEAALFCRPRRGSFDGLTPEYLRWYDIDGRPRELPLSREALAPVMVRHLALPEGQAAAWAVGRSRALPAEDQDWLLTRAQMRHSHRPLDADDLTRLASALEAAALGPLPGPVATANADIAVRAAAVLGAMSDVFTPSPFSHGALAHAFTTFHASHLARVAHRHGLSNQPPHDGGFVDVARWLGTRYDWMRALARAWPDDGSESCGTGCRVETPITGGRRP